MISYSTTYRKYCISNFLINIIKCKKCTYLLDQYDCKLLYTVQCCTFTFSCRCTLQFLKKYISTQHFSSRWLFGLNILQHDFLLPPLQLSAVATKVSHIMIVIFFFAIEKRVERGEGKQGGVSRGLQAICQNPRNTKKLFVMLLLLLSFTALTRNVSFNKTSYLLLLLSNPKS